ncbi:MAG: hypothetical protein C0508_16470, partial [Cyanobacteria bacterium PR.023]|nr:hypothetical protein [Cyanobacteria bacterium PR.023]
MQLSSSSSSRTEILIIALCVAVAVFACVIQNTIHPTGTTLVFDSGHYMGTVQLLCQAIQAQFGGTPLTFSDSHKLNDYLLLDGPLVPLVGTFVFTLLGKIPQASDWRIFIYIEIFFQALATASITSLAFNLGYGKQAKYLALGTGLAWALYPAAILSTNSFLGELPATALLLLAIRLMVQTLKLKAAATSSTTAKILALISGSLLTVVFMSKPALVLSLGLLVTLWMAALFGPFFLPPGSEKARPKCKDKTIMALSFALGAALAATPWLLFTHETSGHWRPSAYRLPIYNITRGMSCDSDGWGTVPLDPTMQSYGEGVSPLGCMASIFKEKPGQSINLALRKPERLWLLPWNDFHHKCLSLGLGLQIFIHQVALILAAIGLILLPLGLRKRHSTANFIAASAPLIILGHAAYIPFETCSRYGFSGMPMVFLLAAMAVEFIVITLRQQSKTSLSIGLCLAAIASLVTARADLLSLIQMLFLPTGLSAFLEYAIKGALMIMVFVLAYKLGSSDQAPKRPLLRIASQSIAVLLSGAIIAVFMAHYLNEREERTWKCRLEVGKQIGRGVKFIKNSKANWHLLLIDCETTHNKSNQSSDSTNSDDPLAGSTVTINSKELPAASFNPASLVLTWAKLDQMQTDFASVFGKKASAVRQWRAYYIPPDYLNNGSNNEISLTAGQDITIFGDSDQINGQAAFIPAIEYLSATKFLQEQESPDGRIITPTWQAKQSQSL